MNRNFTKVEVKTCGTCLFWNGERELIKLVNSKPAYHMKKDYLGGLCSNPDGNFYRKERKNGKCCCKYQSAYNEEKK